MWLFYQKVESLIDESLESIVVSDISKINYILSTFYLPLWAFTRFIMNKRYNIFWTQFRGVVGKGVGNNTSNLVIPRSSPDSGT